MALNKRRTYSTLSKKAVGLLGRMIKMHRMEKKMSAQELADRASVSRTTLHSIEKGEMKSEIGIVFDIATLVGIKLFETETLPLQTIAEHIENKISLLPKSIRTNKGPIDDEF